MHFWGFGVPGLCRGTGRLQGKILFMCFWRVIPGILFQVGMNGDTFCIKAPKKECSKKFAATFKGKFLTKKNGSQNILLFVVLSRFWGASMGKGVATQVSLTFEREKAYKQNPPQKISGQSHFFFFFAPKCWHPVM